MQTASNSIEWVVVFIMVRRILCSQDFSTEDLLQLLVLSLFFYIGPGMTKYYTPGIVYATAVDDLLRHSEAMSGMY